jgi:hypothetical protein
VISIDARPAGTNGWRSWNCKSIDCECGKFVELKLKRSFFPLARLKKGADVLVVLPKLIEATRRGGHEHEYAEGVTERNMGIDGRADGRCNVEA